jgi:hypothetical protein
MTPRIGAAVSLSRARQSLGEGGSTLLKIGPRRTAIRPPPDRDPNSPGIMHGVPYRLFFVRL